MNREFEAALTAATAAASSFEALGAALVATIGDRITFDRLNIGLIDMSRYVFADAYVHGRNVPGRRSDHRRTLRGTVVEAADRAGDGFAFGSDDRAAWLARFPGFGPVFDSGIRAMLAVPMREQGVLTAALVLASRDPQAYPDPALALARDIAAAISERVRTLRREHRAIHAPGRAIPLDARPNVMEIDLGALALNLAQVRCLAGPDRAVIASVKANAYGHGILPVATCLAAAGVEVLATGSIADAIAMREAGIGTTILMMGGALPSAVPDLLRHDLVPTVHNAEMAVAVTDAATRPTPVYVKVDCGMGRLGIPLHDAHRFVLQLARNPRIEVAGLYTHLPFADAAGRDWARTRIARFDDLVAALRRDGLEVPVTQARASAALLAGIDDTCSAVSPGALLYGLSPLDPGLTALPPLHPVMTAISTRLIQVAPSVSTAPAGFESRYAGRVTGATGVVPFGRVDGNRAPLAGQAAHMLIDGLAAPILGVSLEHTVLDLSAVPHAAVGQRVTVLGADGPARIALEDIARWQGDGVNDVLTRLDARMERSILPGG